MFFDLCRPFRIHGFAFRVYYERVSKMPEAFGWKLRCNYGVFACISALVSLDLPPESADPFLLKTLLERSPGERDGSPPGGKSRGLDAAKAEKMLTESLG